MAEIVNLRTRRRQRDRAERAELAAGNRARFGRTAGEKERDRLEQVQAGRTLDGARLDVPAAEPGAAVLDLGTLEVGALDDPVPTGG